MGSCSGNIWVSADGNTYPRDMRRDPAQARAGLGASLPLQGIWWHCVCLQATYPLICGVHSSATGTGDQGDSEGAGSQVRGPQVGCTCVCSVPLATDRGPGKSGSSKGPGRASGLLYSPPRLRSLHLHLRNSESSAQQMLQRVPTAGTCSDAHVHPPSAGAILVTIRPRHRLLQEGQEHRKDMERATLGH